MCSLASCSRVTQEEALARNEPTTARWFDAVLMKARYTCFAPLINQPWVVNLPALLAERVAELGTGPLADERL